MGSKLQGTVMHHMKNINMGGLWTVLRCRRGNLSQGQMHHVIFWVFLGFLEIVPEEQRTVSSVMLQFI